jgi:hypothetical protein
VRSDCWCVLDGTLIPKNRTPCVVASNNSYLDHRSALRGGGGHEGLAVTTVFVMGSSYHPSDRYAYTLQLQTRVTLIGFASLRRYCLEAPTPRLFARVPVHPDFRRSLLHNSQRLHVPVAPSETRSDPARVFSDSRYVGKDSYQDVVVHSTAFQWRGAESIANPQLEVKVCRTVTFSVAFEDK